MTDKDTTPSPGVDIRTIPTQEDVIIQIGDGGIRLTADQARMLGRDLLQAADESEDMGNGAERGDYIASTGELRQRFDEVFAKDPGTDE